LQTTAGKMIFGRLYEEGADAGIHTTDARNINGQRRSYRDTPRASTAAAPRPQGTE
jgi:hypothetical protein